MSKRLNSKQFLSRLTAPSVRSTLVGRASGGAAALTLAAAFLAPRPAEAVPFFTDVTTTQFPNPQTCTNNTPVGRNFKLGCYTSWLVTSDLDQDGDLDLMFANGGDYYLVGQPEPSVAYTNDGTGIFTEVTATMFNGALSRLRQVAIGDIDGDGDRDIYQAGGYGADLDKLWVQTAPGVYENQAATLLPPGLKSSTPGFHMGDLDGDGDLDIVTADWGNATTTQPVVLSLYLNDGTGKFVLEATQSDSTVADDRFPPTIPFQAATSNAYWGVRAIDIDFADVDNDFDLDILVNMRNGISRILINDGKAFFKDGNGQVKFKTTNGVIDVVDNRQVVISNYPMKYGPYVYNQEVCDIDNDGDLDLLLDNAARRPAGITSGNFTQILANDGTGKFVDVSRERIFGEPGFDDNAVKCVDVNNDGNNDMVVASLGQNEKLLLNDGTGLFNYVAGGIPVVGDASLGIDMGDFNGDGIFDLVTGQGESGSNYINRLFMGVADPAGAAKDTRAPKFRKIQTPKAIAGEPIVFHMAITDSVTSETGEMVKSVNVVYQKNSTTGTVKAKFIGGDLWRVEIPAQPAFTSISLTPNATDRGNNKGYGATMSFVVQPAPVVGSGGTGGTGGTDPGTGGVPDTGTGGVPDTGGEGGVPATGTGGVPAEEPGSGGVPATGTGGVPAEEPGSGGVPVTGSGGEPAEGSGGKGGKGGKPSDGGESSSEGGETGSGSGGGSSDDDGGCTVTSTATGSSTGSLLAALGLALVAGLRRRRRGE